MNFGTLERPRHGFLVCNYIPEMLGRAGHFTPTVWWCPGFSGFSGFSQEISDGLSGMFIPSSMVIGMVLTHPNWLGLCFHPCRSQKRWLWGYSGNNSVMHPLLPEQRGPETARNGSKRQLVLFWTPSGEMFLDDGFIVPLNMVKHRIMQGRVKTCRLLGCWAPMCMLFW